MSRWGQLGAAKAADVTAHRPGYPLTLPAGFPGTYPEYFGTALWLYEHLLSRDGRYDIDIS